MFVTKKFHRSEIAEINHLHKMELDDIESLHIMPLEDELKGSRHEVDNHRKTIDELHLKLDAHLIEEKKLKDSLFEIQGMYTRDTDSLTRKLMETQDMHEQALVKIRILEGDNDSIRKALEKSRVELVSRWDIIEKNKEEIKILQAESIDLKAKLEAAYVKLFPEKKPKAAPKKRRASSNVIRNPRRRQRSSSGRT
jgi:chromosome segregation ATPase